MENIFVNACILHFTYGRGGFDELRKKPDGSFITLSIDICKYIEHIFPLSIFSMSYLFYIHITQ